MKEYHQEDLRRTFALVMPSLFEKFPSLHDVYTEPKVVLNFYYGLTIGCPTFGTDRERAAQFPTRRAAINQAARMGRSDLRPLPIAVLELR